MNQLEVALCQMTSVDDVDTNLMMMQDLLCRTKAQTRLVLFPENCLYMRIVEGEKIKGMMLSDDCFSVLAEEAKKRSLYIHLGSLPLWHEGHLYNSSLLITDRGEVKPQYQKMHLFDIKLENDKAIRESDVFRHGQFPSIFEIDGWRIGESICYDLRFSELYSWYSRRNIDVILVPSAFLVKTGMAHWHILLRARAIETQSYVLAAAQAGVHRSQKLGLRETYGHSLAVHPWGDLLVEAQTARPEVLHLTLQRSEIESVRKQIPMKDHRRLTNL